MPASPAPPAAPGGPRRRRSPGGSVPHRRRPRRRPSRRPVRRTGRRRADGGLVRAGPPSGEAGFATVEVSVALPALVLVTVAAMWGVSIASAQLSCTDAARAGARAAARGEPLTAVRGRVTAAAPGGATVQVTRDDAVTRVEVIAEVHAPVPTGLPPVVLRAEAVSATEPGAAS
ncbi:hypothetical protein EIO00_17185 [Thermomonospora catenispora]|nr:hypothetical protein EIO00_17185 [Thermomonospora catenispora]